MKPKRNLCGHCDAGLPIQCTCGNEWFIRKSGELDNLWWPYYWPLGSSVGHRMCWAYNFKAAKLLFPTVAKKFMEGKK